jgi:hypothetical protein
MWTLRSRWAAITGCWRWVWPMKWHGFAWLALVAVGIAWGVTRFSGLGDSPPGFFMDEATPAVHAMCLAQTGKNVDGLEWPLYSRAAGGGHHPLTLLVFEIGWMKVFGNSREAIRAVPAFWIMLTALALFLVAREIAVMVPPSGDEASARASRAFPWLTLLAAMVSPWSFQFGRVAWEAPLAPALMMLGIWALFRCDRSGRSPVAWAVLAGLLGAGSMITYPPLRVTVPLAYFTLGMVLLALRSGWRSRLLLLRALALGAIVAAVCLAPTLMMLSEGKINGRMNNVAIWRPDWVSEHAGSAPRWMFLLETFLDNVLTHLRPSFLIFQGDASLRSSAHVSGQLSPVDLLAIAFALGAVAVVAYRMLSRTGAGRPAPASPTAVGRWLCVTALCALLGFFYGIAPAALTYEAIPHALRAIGAWPFVALFTGAALALGWSRRGWLSATIAVVALAHTIHFIPAYFHAYDATPKYWFMREMTDTIWTEHDQGVPPKPIREIVKNHMAYSYQYDEIPLYYLMSAGNMTCLDAKAAVKAFREEEKSH